MPKSAQGTVKVRTRQKRGLTIGSKGILPARREKGHSPPKPGDVSTENGRLLPGKRTARKVIFLKNRHKTHPCNICCGDESARCPSRAVGHLRSQGSPWGRKYVKNPYKMRQNRHYSTFWRGYGEFRGHRAAPPHAKRPAIHHGQRGAANRKRKEWSHGGGTGHVAPGLPHPYHLLAQDEVFQRIGQVGGLLG